MSRLHPEGNGVPSRVGLDRRGALAMRLTSKRHRSALAVLLALVCVAAVTIVVVRQHAGLGPPAAVTVMTRNLYLGGDITRPLRAAEGRTGSAALLALGHANRELRDIVDRTDFATRSTLLAAEIEAAKPDLVGLQEVAQWRHGPLQLDHLGRPDATTVDIDHLSMLLADLDAQGVGYDVVQVQQESDVEAPAFSGDPLTGSAAAAEDVRLTVRDAILVRRGSSVHVTGAGSGQYRPRIDLDLGGLGVSFVRGFAWADVTAGSTRFRFVTTHLESQSADVALAQAAELLSGPAASPSVAEVVVCDCNSDPEDNAIRAGESVPRSAAYQRLAGSGFDDQWLALDRGAGRTATLSELVNDSTAAAFDRRVDLVLARSTPSDPVRAVTGRVTGDEPNDRDPQTGLWPSDHAGVVVELRIG